MTPAVARDDYAHKSKDPAESVLSSVQTARLAARVGSRGDAFGPYVSVLLSESEDATARADGSFSRIQPPDRASDLTRARLIRLLDRAASGVSRLRIDARRGELAGLERRSAPLGRLARRLQAFIDDPGPVTAKRDAVTR